MERKTVRIDFAKPGASGADRIGTYVAVLEYNVRDAGVTWVDWRLYEVKALGSDGRFGYTRAGAPDPLDLVWDELINAEPTVRGHCKWDGCAELQLNEHVCSVSGLRLMLEAIQRVYVECAKVTASDAWADCRMEGWDK